MSICPTSGKTKYVTQKDADAGLLRMKERMSSYEGESYYCLYCGSYHFGRSSSKEKKSNKIKKG